MLEANWGDMFEITVTNNISAPEEGTLLHWHGLFQKETPWYDGVPAVDMVSPSVNGIRVDTTADIFTVPHCPRSKLYLQLQSGCIRIIMVALSLRLPVGRRYLGAYGYLRVSLPAVVEYLPGLMPIDLKMPTMIST